MTCGSKVRRSLLYIFLIDEESSTDAGKNITQNITELSCSSGANCLNNGSPTRARTWDLRIDSPSEKSPESRAPLGFRGFRLGNRFADFALVSPGSRPILLFQFPSPLSCVVLGTLIKTRRKAIGRTRSWYRVNVHPRPPAAGQADATNGCNVATPAVQSPLINWRYRPGADVRQMRREQWDGPLLT